MSSFQYILLSYLDLVWRLSHGSPRRVSLPSEARSYASSRRDVSLSRPANTDQQSKRRSYALFLSLSGTSLHWRTSCSFFYVSSGYGPRQPRIQYRCLSHRNISQILHSIYRLAFPSIRQAPRQVLAKLSMLLLSWVSIKRGAG